MKIASGDYEIEVIDDNFYVENSSKNNYQFKYSDGKAITGRVYSINKRGIIVRALNSQSELSSTILCENGGRTAINIDLFKIIDDDLLICIGDKIYCLKIPSLQINWFRRGTLGTTYSINNFKEDYLIFGELGVSRMNKKGDELWAYKGSDGIFIAGEGKLKIKDKSIELIDGNGEKFVIDESGKEMD